MSETANAESTITIEVVQVGKGKTAVVVPEGCTWQEVVEKLGGSGKQLTNRGEDLTKKQGGPQSGDTVAVGPRSVKQG